MRRRCGFTLLEVLLAVFVLATVGVFLIENSGRTLAALSLSERESEVSRLAAERLRELLDSGEFPDLGTTRGSFDDPWQDWIWELSVEPYAVPLPPAQADAMRSSSIFLTTPIGSGSGRLDPSVRRVTARVHHVDEDPEAAAGLVLFAVDQGALAPSAGGTDRAPGSDDVGTDAGARGAASRDAREMQNLREVPQVR